MTILRHCDDGDALCRDCGQPIPRGQRRCGPCQMRREAQADVEAALAPLAPLFPQFTLATLFFAVTWIAVCLGALKLSPCLGLLLIFLTMPALLRTMALGAGESIAPRPGKRVVTFFASLGIMFLVLVISGSLLGGFVWLALLAAFHSPYPDSVHTMGAIFAITMGVLGAFGSAAAILWYTRWLGA